MPARPAFFETLGRETLRLEREVNRQAGFTERDDDWFSPRRGRCSVRAQGRSEERERQADAAGCSVTHGETRVDRA
jgi:hypothetical protein